MKTTDDQTEMFIVVDENNHILGYRSRFDCHHDKTLIHRTSGVLVFDGDRFLLQKRSNTKDMQPGKWGISAAGHVSKGETTKQTAIREAKEEIGITVGQVKKVVTFLSRASNESEMATLYFTKSKGPFAIDPKEVQEVRFFTLGELKSQIQSGTIELTECCLETLKQIQYLS